MTIFLYIGKHVLTLSLSICETFLGENGLNLANAGYISYSHKIVQRLTLWATLYIVVVIKIIYLERW